MQCYLKCYLLIFAKQLIHEHYLFSFDLIGCTMKNKIRKTVDVRFCSYARWFQPSALMHLKVYLVFDRLK